MHVVITKNEPGTGSDNSGLDRAKLREVVGDLSQVASPTPIKEGDLVVHPSTEKICKVMRFEGEGRAVIKESPEDPEVQVELIELSHLSDVAHGYNLATKL